MAAQILMKEEFHQAIAVFKSMNESNQNTDVEEI